MSEWLFADLRAISLGAVTIKMLLFLVCGGLIGLDRGLRGQAAGLRTHILVCMGACIAMITGQYIYLKVSPNVDPARLGAQVISGIGFLGAGAIMGATHNRVRGLTTAAGLWTVACIGLVIGIGFYEAAIIGTIMVLLAIIAFRKLDKLVASRSPVLSAYLELENMSYTHGLLENIRTHRMKLNSMEIQNPKSDLKGAVGLVLTVQKDRWRDSIDMMGILGETEGLLFIEEV